MRDSVPGDFVDYIGFTDPPFVKTEPGGVLFVHAKHFEQTLRHALLRHWGCGQTDFLDVFAQFLPAEFYQLCISIENQSGQEIYLALEADPKDELVGSETEVRMDAGRIGAVKAIDATHEG